MVRIASLLLLTACGGALSEEIRDCAGDHEGSYEGGASGDLSAELDKDGSLRVTFQTVLVPVKTEAQVDEDGNVSGCERENCVDGTYDFTDCSAEGVWEDQFGSTGTWALTSI